MGTVFKIYLPCVEGRHTPGELDDTRSESPARGSETVLLVEDKQAVQGYTVLEAKDGLDALSVPRTMPRPSI